MNAHTQPWFYPIFAAVLGKDSETVLIPLPMDDSSLAVREYAKARGFGYAGMMSLWPREPRSKAECEPGMEQVMIDAVPKFAEFVKETLTARFQSMSLEHIYRLQDTRVN